MPSKTDEELGLRAELYGIFSAALREPEPIYPNHERFNKIWNLFPIEGEFKPLGSAPKDYGAEFRKIFGHNLSPDCPPYESHYDHAGIFRKTQTLADLAGFYKAFGVELAGGDRRGDHLPVELEFLSLLLHKEALALENGDSKNVEICRKARTRFLRIHLAAWYPMFAGAVINKGTDGCIEWLVRRLAAFIAFDAISLGIDLKIREKDKGPVREEVDEDGCSLCPIGSGDEKI